MTYPDIVVTLVSLATLGAGLMAGVFFAFSTFIMASLDRLGATAARDAMNAINDVILRSWFMGLFFGSTVLYLVLALVAVLDADLAGRWWIFLAGGLYVVGMFLCTALFNVPLNNRLAATAANDRDPSAAWSHYLKHWTRWNHLRSICSLLAMMAGIAYLVWHAGR